MASQPRKGGISLPERRLPKTNDQVTLITRFSNSAIVSRGKQAAGEAVCVSKRLLRSTGKAAWIAGTTFLILVVPLIIEMDREQQLNELELQQTSLLGAPPVNPTHPVRRYLESSFGKGKKGKSEECRVKSGG
ncbi:hypothetical protein Dsin_024764 [Dipteronia sinensis]|uniref:Mitochondrial import receptor subunit TOM9-2 n=1 Tax=Dipteronia sinensis TaxID=43782 RepID=A0AAD9ZVP0_9ROSI|nr:hypothetical protein Dsin_024764 [Dipteronia sinensis]